MSKNNDVFQVLVTSGNSAPLAINNRITDLAVGQIGVFSAKDNTSITTATADSDTREIYLAVGVDRDGDSVLDDVVKSSGIIQMKNITAYTARCYTPHQAQKIDLTGFEATCDTEYTLKVGVRNQTAYANYGSNYPFKTFVVKTSCCETTCGGCPEGDCVELASLLVSAVNDDAEAIFTANAFVYRGSVVVSAGAVTTSGTITIGVGSESFAVEVVEDDTIAQVAAKIAAAVNDTTTSVYIAIATATTVYFYLKTTATEVTAAVTFTDTDTTGVTASSTPDFAYYAISDIAAFKAANPGVCIAVRLTSNFAALNTFCKTNLKYEFPRGSALDVVLSTGFACNGTVTTVQDLVFEEGAGYDIAQLETIAGGWNGFPGVYRQSALVGETIGDFSVLASKTGKYVQINITSEQESEAGWGSYKNKLNTLIAVPCGETTTLEGLLDILDKAVSLNTNFGPATDAIDECPTCTTVYPTTDIDDITEDGIG